jgi:hypothetical protein
MKGFVRKVFKKKPKKSGEASSGQGKKDNKASSGSEKKRRD